MKEERKIKDREKLEKRLEECEKTKEEYLEGWKRTKADFINYQRRLEQILTEKLEHSTQSLFLDFLKIIDDFERLEKASREKKTNLTILKTAIQQIQKKIEQFLAEKKISRLKTVGEEFNPHWHEAIQQVEASSKQKPNTVVEEVEAGYLINGKLLRPAKVKVAK